MALLNCLGLLFVMETKEQLISAVRQWVKIDNEIRTLRKELLIRRKKMAEITKELMTTMHGNNIDCFDLNDGKIVYAKKDVKKPISQKSLLKIISKYFDGDELRAHDLNSYILENREVVTKESIVRKIKKNDLMNYPAPPTEETA